MKIEGVPEGWELVRIGIVKRDEWYIGQHGKPEQAPLNMLPANFPIIRKIEPVLDVSKIRLKKGWIAQDKNGKTHWYSNEPVSPKSTTGIEWFSSNGLVARLDMAVTIPWREDVPWTERIMEVGNE